MLRQINRGFQFDYCPLASRKGINRACPDMAHAGLSNIPPQLFYYRAAFRRKKGSFDSKT
ncbi:hypothetical protein EMPG_14354 [Blastomyces silverae]|uniref:Uncharacterized protein n=1 Tax=Blastomyces silverae TaxID=2060906 RepID=A0A0H1BFU5_9EURO|nr:hypothetical protein EMPG_14354 [Blastomyces silverae]